jgi:hypothetical protein
MFRVISLRPSRQPLCLQPFPVGMQGQLLAYSLMVSAGSGCANSFSASVNLSIMLSHSMKNLADGCVMPSAQHRTTSYIRRVLNSGWELC